MQQVYFAVVDSIPDALIYVKSLRAWSIFASHVMISGMVIGRDFELLLLLVSKFFGSGHQYIIVGSR